MLRVRAGTGITATRGGAGACAGADRIRTFTVALADRVSRAPRDSRLNPSNPVSFKTLSR